MKLKFHCRTDERQYEADHTCPYCWSLVEEDEADLHLDTCRALAKTLLASGLLGKPMAEDALMSVPIHLPKVPRPSFALQTA